jgi:hypothetical protein
MLQKGDLVHPRTLGSIRLEMAKTMQITTMFYQGLRISDFDAGKMFGKKQVVSGPNVWLGVDVND